jgi:hypothetical protein
VAAKTLRSNTSQFQLNEKSEMQVEKKLWTEEVRLCALRLATMRISSALLLFLDRGVCIYEEFRFQPMIMMDVAVLKS